MALYPVSLTSPDRLVGISQRGLTARAATMATRPFPAATYSSPKRIPAHTAAARRTAGRISTADTATTAHLLRRDQLLDIEVRSMPRWLVSPPNRKDMPSGSSSASVADSATDAGRRPSARGKG